MTELILKTDTTKSRLYLGTNILEDLLPTLCKSLSHDNKVAVITDSTVNDLYAPRVADALQNAGITPFSYAFPAGESSKKLATVEKIYEFLAKNGFSRTHTVIALGGGVVGDTVGFAAATFLRGIRSIQIPTTLLAQVDSSVGGKCGVDLSCGKNLVGAFNQPDCVLIDTSLLSTLPADIFTDGMGEVVKYGCILDENLFCDLETKPIQTILPDVITRCVSHKRDVVEQDEHDTGLRMLLNFGHTIGHAIETCGNYTTHPHGQCVSRGMVAAVRIGIKLGITPPETLPRLQALLAKYGLETDIPYPTQMLADVLAKDKKVLSGKLNFILLERIGKAIIHPIALNDLVELLPIINETEVS